MGLTPGPNFNDPAAAGPQAFGRQQSTGGVMHGFAVHRYAELQERQQRLHKLSKNLQARAESAAAKQTAKIVTTMKHVFRIIVGFSRSK